MTTVDYSALLYDPVYAEIGVPAVFTVTNVTGGAVANITVIDDTRPKMLPAGSSAEVHDVAPGAFVRIPELVENGIPRGDAWRDALLSFNGRDWMVTYWVVRGSPNGEDQGEVRFELKSVNG